MPKRLTKAHLEAAIYSVRYINSKDASTAYLGTTTLCVLTMKNGMKVTGTSACLNPADYCEIDGKQYARDDAFKKLWELEGYAAADREYRSGLAITKALEVVVSPKVTISSDALMASLRSNPEFAFERQVVTAVMRNRDKQAK